MSDYRKPPYWLPVGFEDHSGAVIEAAALIAERIRAELVCCPSEHIDAMQQLMIELGGRPMHHIHEFHPICYWGEMAARLAEDPHSLLLHPYGCDGQHPGPCWRTRPGEEDDDDVASADH